MVVVYVLPPSHAGGAAVVSLLEFGLWAAREPGKVVVCCCCPRGCWKRGNVVCGWFGVAFVEDLGGLGEVVLGRLGCS